MLLVSRRRTPKLQTSDVLYGHNPRGTFVVPYPGYKDTDQWKYTKRASTHDNNSTWVTVKLQEIIVTDYKLECDCVASYLWICIINQNV